MTAPEAVGYSREFIVRRRLVWIPLGFMYASYYMTRYNMPAANPAIREAYGFSKQDFGVAITAFFWAYALGQFTNGILTDRIGGRRAMAVGAVGTIVLNVLLGILGQTGVLSTFILIWGVNGYFQAFGAPALVKVNGQWFGIRERGTFSGIFGLMIQGGRFVVGPLSLYLSSHFPWPWTFWVPSMITSVAAVLMWIYVRDNPEDVGLPPVDHGDAHGVEDEKPAPLGWIIKKVFSSRTLWIISGAYFCTGVVRHGLDQWYVSYLKEVQHINPNDWGQYVTAYIFPIAATAGSFAAGIASDKLFGARRGPPTAVMYAAQLVLLFAFQFVAHPVLAIALLVMLQFFVNGPHSLLGGAAAMDFGGRKAAGTAAGLIDAFQYIGAGLTGFGVGAIVDKVGWGGWTASLMAFAALGAILMGSLWNARPVKKAGGH